MTIIQCIFFRKNNIKHNDTDNAIYNNTSINLHQVPLLISGRDKSEYEMDYRASIFL